MHALWWGPLLDTDPFDGVLARRFWAADGTLVGLSVWYCVWWSIAESLSFLWVFNGVFVYDLRNPNEAFFIWLSGFRGYFWFSYVPGTFPQYITLTKKILTLIYVALDGYLAKDLLGQWWGLVRLLYTSDGRIGRLLWAPTHSHEPGPPYTQRRLMVVCKEFVILKAVLVKWISIFLEFSWCVLYLSAY